MITYKRFTEENDWEGEKWHFYIPVPGNEEALSKLEKLISEKGYDDIYAFHKEMFTEAEVDVLVKYSEQGYMPHHNKLSGLLDYKSLLKAMDFVDEDKDPLYKGGIKEYVK